MAFLVTEIAMEIMGCKYYDVDGLPVSNFEDLVRYNKSGKRTNSADLSSLQDYLDGENFIDQQGNKLVFTNFPTKVQPTTSVPKVVSANTVVHIPRIQDPRISKTKPSTVVLNRRPSFSSSFSNFIEDQNKEKPHSQVNNNASLFQRSMTQIGMGNLGNRKIIIKPKVTPSTAGKPIPVITLPVKPIPPRVQYQVPAKKPTPPVPKIVSVRTTNSIPTLVSGGTGTQFKGPPAPVVSGAVGTQFGGNQYSKEPQPAVSGGGGTQFGAPLPPRPSNGDNRPAAPKVARILHRRHTLFQKQPY